MIIFKSFFAAAFERKRVFGMERKKGFIHIVEIVVISLIVFVLVIQLGSVPPARADWDNAKIMLQGNDMLFSLDGSGVNWLDPNAVVRSMDSLLAGTNIKYDVTVTNAIKADISVGCICTDSELNTFSHSLTQFTLNRETVDFSVLKIDPNRPSFPTMYDVIIVGPNAFSRGLAGYRTEMKAFLADGRGILEIANIGSQAGLDEAQSEVFGLEWNTRTFPTNSKIAFVPDRGSAFYSIERYFRHMPSSINFSNWTGFATFLEPGERIAASGGTAVLEQKGSEVAGLVARDGVEGNGRTAWLSGGDDNLEERKVLIRALVSWLAGDSYRVVAGDIASPVRFSMFKVLGPDMFQPVKITLSLGYIF
jgi:hypothetical protein